MEALSDILLRIHDMPFEELEKHMQERSAARVQFDRENRILTPFYEEKQAYIQAQNRGPAHLAQGFTAGV